MSGPSSTIRKYRKVQKEKEVTQVNEIRLTGTNYVGKYITYAASLLMGETDPKVDSVILKATGVATKGACLVAEILRHRIKGLHQLSSIKTITVTDEYEPLEEGLEKVTVERKLAVLEITLSKKAGVLDTNAPGYQAPLPEDQVQEEEIKDLLRRGGERGGRGGERGSRGGRGGRRGGRGGRGGRRGGRGGNRGGDREDREEREERGDRPYRGGRGRGGDRPRGGDREGGYRGGDREGGYRGGDREGGYRGDRPRGDRPRGGDREGGYRGGDREGGYRGGDREGGYRGGERGARRGTYRPRGERRGGRGGERTQETTKQ